MNRRVRLFLEGLADRAGYRVYPKWRVERLGSIGFADHLSRLFAYLGVDTVLDVGANEGQYRDFLRDEVGFEGRIVSFEPNPALIGRLRGRAGRDDRWEVHQLGLGAEAGRLRFNVAKSSVYSSFRRPSARCTKEFEGSNETEEEIEVEVSTLADVFAGDASLRAAKVYLKSDTQGFDLEVIKGCGAILHAIRGLQAELSITPIYEDVPSYLDVLSYLDAQDFSPCAFSAIGQGHVAKLVEIDCCMINNRFHDGTILLP